MAQTADRTPGPSPAERGAGRFWGLVLGWLFWWLRPKTLVLTGPLGAVAEAAKALGADNAGVMGEAVFFMRCGNLEIERIGNLLAIENRSFPLGKSFFSFY
jgi:hypothetical protein